MVVVLFSCLMIGYDFVYHNGFNAGMKCAGFISITPPIKIGNVEFME